VLTLLKRGWPSPDEIAGQCYIRVGGFSWGELFCIPVSVRFAYYMIAEYANIVMPCKSLLFKTRTHPLKNYTRVILIDLWFGESFPINSQLV
jgi:hypothetical protein